MKSWQVQIIMWIVVFILVIATSYWFATICAPESLWLWRDILGVLSEGTCR